jgi:hypothetical protein
VAHSDGERRSWSRTVERLRERAKSPRESDETKRELRQVDGDSGWGRTGLGLWKVEAHGFGSGSLALCESLVTNE